MLHDLFFKTDRAPRAGLARKLAVVAALGVILTGCATRQERMAALNAQDDEICRSWGLAPGTPAYLRCREQQQDLETRRGRSDR